MKKNEQKIELNCVLIDLLVDGTLLRLECDAEHDDRLISDLNELNQIFLDDLEVDLNPRGIRSINGREMFIRLFTDEIGRVCGRIFKYTYDTTGGEIYVEGLAEVPNSAITNIIFACTENKQECGYVYFAGAMCRAGGQKHICMYRY